MSAPLNGNNAAAGDGATEGQFETGDMMAKSTPKSEEKYVSASGSGQALIKLKVYEDDTATVWNETYQRRLYPANPNQGYASYDDAKEFFDSLRAVARSGA